MQQVEELVTTMKAAVEDRSNLRLSAAFPVMAGLVEHAACNITRSLAISNGRTAYHALHKTHYLKKGLAQKRLCNELPILEILILGKG